MKKNLTYFGLTLVSLFFALSSVNATDLTAQIETGSAGLGDSITFEKSYDKEKDINNILVTLLVDEDKINNILEQKSGSGSTLSIFYFSINPNLTGSNFKKNFVWYGDKLIDTTFESAFATLNTSIAGEAAVNYDEVYPNALSVQYSTDGGKTWLASDKKGDGVTTIRADLLSKLSLSDPEDLVYGENFRFSMYDKYTQIWGWDILDADNKSVGKEYVSVNWQIKFPVAAKINDQQVLFYNLEDAINSKSTSITVNEDLKVDADIEIPADVTLIIADGVVVEVLDGNSFTNKGTVLGTVKVDGVEKTYSNVFVKDVENGKVVVDKTNAMNGETVTVTTTGDKNYVLESLTVLNKTTNKVIELRDGKFVMPNGDVEVVAKFKAVTVKNPKTFDNIGLYIVSIIISFVAIIFNLKYLKKIDN